MALLCNRYGSFMSNNARVMFVVSILELLFTWWIFNRHWLHYTMYYIIYFIAFRQVIKSIFLNILYKLFKYNNYPPNHHCSNNTSNFAAGKKGVVAISEACLNKFATIKTRLREALFCQLLLMDRTLNFINWSDAKLLPLLANSFLFSAFKLY